MGLNKNNQDGIDITRENYIMINFLKEFEEKFKQEFYNDIKNLLEKISNEKVYACAFGTDSDFSTLFLAINTEESLKKHITDMENEGLCNSQEDKIYYRWCLSEFKYGNAHFNHIYKLLNSTENVSDYKDKIVEIIAKTVLSTDSEVFKQYGQLKEDITFFVSMTDDDMAEELENQSVIKMTPKDLAKDFLMRYGRDN